MDERVVVSTLHSFVSDCGDHFVSKNGWPGSTRPSRRQIGAVAIIRACYSKHYCVVLVGEVVGRLCWKWCGRSLRRNRRRLISIPQLLSSALYYDPPKARRACLARKMMLRSISCLIKQCSGWTQMLSNTLWPAPNAWDVWRKSPSH